MNNQPTRQHNSNIYNIPDSIDVYTDGACSKNPGPGGYGIVFIYHNQVSYLSSGRPNVTNNIMELEAAAVALERLRDFNGTINLYTDSAYLVNGITKYISNWKRNGYKTTNDQPVKNLELWIRIDAINSVKRVNWFHVKGHSGNYYNEVADSLARQACEKYKNY